MRWRGPGQVGVSVPTLCLLRAALAYVSPLYDLMFAMQGLGSYGALASGSAPEGFAAAVSSGEAVCGIGLTEPGAGSDVSLIATRAERSSDGSYRLDGEKIFISNAASQPTFACMPGPMCIPKGCRRSSCR